MQCPISRIWGCVPLSIITVGDKLAVGSHQSMGPSDTSKDERRSELEEELRGTGWADSCAACADDADS